MSDIHNTVVYRAIFVYVGVFLSLIMEFNQIATAGATMAAGSQFLKKCIDQKE